MAPSMPSVFTIPANRAFADALAAGLIAMTRHEPLGLARATLFVPSNRAGKAISDAFVRRAEGGLLLPRLIAVGDPNLDERLGGLFDPLLSDPVPPAIDPVERQFILARLVSEARVLAGEPVEGAEAVRLAADLARTIDELTIEGVTTADLAKAVENPELSDHWRRALSVLEAVADRWPGELAKRRQIDMADRRNRLLRGLGARWRDAPPQGLVVAAGISSGAPAVAELLHVIARLPQGMVVLPGLDASGPAAEWDALGPFAREEGMAPRRSIETHPQFQMKLLLDRLGVGRGEVQNWRWGGRRDAAAVRARAIANAMAPAEFTDKWATLPNAERRLSGVRAIELANPAEEAQAIAIALRGAIETPGRTAALVTPDRALARRVAAHLKRWDIVADDSAGTPLSLTPAGALLLGIAEAAAERFAPVPLLALLKHPLVMKGEERLDWLEGARALDVALRGPRPAPGLGGVTAFLLDGDRHTAWKRKAALGFWGEARKLLEPLEAAFSNPSTPLRSSRATSRDVGMGERVSTSLDTSGEGEEGGTLASYLAALREAATALTGDAAWAGPDGRAAADMIAELEAAAPLGPERFDPAGLVPMLRGFTDAQAVRPPQGGHPRVSIWGLLEARLQQADLMVLGGLNEGIWPTLPSPDPWLAPRIRAELGLPGLERRIGLSAHDFAMALGAKQVIVTRARRDARAPTIASRFWLRLEAMTGGMTQHPALRSWALALDRTAEVPPARRPAPVPPVEHRPKEIAVTKLDRLKADPYAFYADAMLKLYPLDAVDADPTAAWRGTAVHAVLEAWMLEDGADPEQLLPRARAMLDAMAAHPVMRALWEPRLLEAIGQFADFFRDMKRDNRRPLVAEVKGTTRIAGVTLKGTVDRIDRLPGGGLAIVDYKTGTPPKGKQVAAGYAMQLGLLGLIAEHGGFKDEKDAVIEGTPEAFEYWSLARAVGSGLLGYISTPVGGRGGIDPTDFMPLAARVFEEAAGKWLTGLEPFTAKLHPEHAPYGDFDQLMRLDEWYGRGQ
ncbi:double-strand break repair protein AddB [Sphingomonas crocodyli]|uniref:Double-strand break repair protein AddB n=1 Tax=Sphingomonas crocodyli TaxID=1979270 RepID=A0A437LV27_9SPHN|nr:double-strand break repair protein AddB [Sphingomonas crocodyli]